MSVDFALLWIQAWPLLLLGPVLILCDVLLHRRRREELRRRIGARFVVLARESDDVRRRIRVLCRCGAMSFAALALLEPVSLEGEEHKTLRGADIICCLDVSRSMLSRDLPPDRLRRAHRELLDLASSARGDRLGLVAFAGEAEWVVPLTSDSHSFAALVQRCDPWMLSKGGTDLASALELAGSSISGDADVPRSILLLTDGEDLGGRARAAAEILGSRGITVHAVGFGTRSGSKIPSDDSGSSFLTDSSGAEVISALDPESLEAVCAAAGGEYVDAAGVATPLRRLYERHIRQKVESAADASPARGRAPLFQLPLALSVLLGVTALSISHRRKP